MAPLMLALTLVVGSTGTVLASNSARPGDLLYPLDRATEAVEGSLLVGDSKAHFEAILATERIDELHALLNDETVKGPDGHLTEQGKERVDSAAADMLQFATEATFDEATREKFLSGLHNEVDGVDEDRSGEISGENAAQGENQDKNHEGNGTATRGGEDGTDRGEGQRHGNNGTKNIITHTGTTTNNTGSTTSNGTWFPAGGVTGQQGSDKEDDNQTEGDDTSSSRSHDATNRGGDDD